jgi:hypothetical protein
MYKNSQSSIVKKQNPIENGQKTWRDISQREYSDDKLTHEKMFIVISIREMQIKTTMSYHNHQNQK